LSSSFSSTQASQTQDGKPRARETASIAVADHQSGTGIQLYLALVDKYGNIVKYGADSRIETKILTNTNEPYTAAVTGSTSFAPSNG